MAVISGCPRRDLRGWLGVKYHLLTHSLTLGLRWKEIEKEKKSKKGGGGGGGEEKTTEVGGEQQEVEDEVEEEGGEEESRCDVYSSYWIQSYNRRLSEWEDKMEGRGGGGGGGGGEGGRREGTQNISSGVNFWALHYRLQRRRNSMSENSCSQSTRAIQHSR